MTKEKLPVEKPLTIKQEKFCMKYVECGNASEAYRHAYDAENMKMETINRNAKALLDDSKIATRVEELRKQHSKRHEVTVDSITEELNEAKELAKDEKQLATLVNAIMGKAKLHGLLVDKKNIDMSVSYTQYLDGLGEE